MQAPTFCKTEHDGEDTQNPVRLIGDVPQLVMDLCKVTPFDRYELHGADFGVDEDIDTALVFARCAGLKVTQHVFINEALTSDLPVMEFRTPPEQLSGFCRWRGQR